MSTQDLKLFDLLDGLEMTKSQYEWLARRFENMTAKEALLFRGAMQIEQPQATCDVMQIANQLEHYELLYGAGNDFALGNFVMEHIFYPSSQTREFLDPAKVGAAYRQKDGNTFCDGNFIRLSSPLDLSQNMQISRSWKNPSSAATMELWLRRSRRRMCLRPSAV